MDIPLLGRAFLVVPGYSTNKLTIRGLNLSDVRTAVNVCLTRRTAVCIIRSSTLGFAQQELFPSPLPAS